MRDGSIRARLLAATLIIGLVPLAPAPSGAQTNPAHSIADKFAKEAAKPSEDARRKAAEDKRRAEAQKQKREEERRIAEEREMLGEAQREAEQRRAELVKARAEQEAAELAAAQRKAEEERVIADAKAADDLKRLEAARIADELRIAAEKAAEDAKRIADLRAADEQRKLAEAKAAEDAKMLAEAKAAEDRRLNEARIAEERRLADAKQAEERAAAERIADALRTAEAKRSEEQRTAEIRDLEARKADAARQAALAAERDAEGQRVAERLRQARLERDQKAADIKTGSLPEVVPSTSSAQNPALRDASAPHQHATTVGASADTPFSGRVAVLLLLEPGNRGIRRHNKTADPLLCTDSGCYVSNGASADATFMPGRKALGLNRTFGERAGACRQSLGCVFRGIELGTLPRMLQPIDMRVMRHDRREAQTIDQLADCRQVAGRLACRTTIEASTYIMWVVPETVASAAGAEALERALADGLPGGDHASLANETRPQ